MKSRGFTIIELLMATIVIGILASIGAISYGNYQRSLTVSQLKSDLNGVASAMENSRTFGNSYPITVPSTFTASPTITLSGGSNDGGKTYCVDSSSSKDASLHYYIDSINALQGAQLGTCMTRTGCYLPGFVDVTGSATYGTSDFCVMKYEAKDVGGVATSQASGVPWEISRATAATKASEVCSGCHLITEAEWMTIVQNVLNVASNWSNGVVGSGFVYSGHNDGAPTGPQVASTDDNDGYYNTNDFSGDSGVTGGMVGNTQRRTLTLTNGKVIWDMAANTAEWASGVAGSGKPGVDGGGLAWREWTDITNPGSLTVDPSPTGTGISGASGWDSVEGLGRLISDVADVSDRSFMRGGAWPNNVYSGIAALDIRYDYGDLSTVCGFRVAK